MTTRASKNEMTNTTWNLRRMNINIPKYSDEPTMNITSVPYDHSRPSITGISLELPKACEMPNETNVHSSENAHVMLNSSIENLTYFEASYAHFLLANCEIVTPMGAVGPQDMKDKKPKIGEVLIPPRSHSNVYSLIFKYNHFENINEE